MVMKVTASFKKFHLTSIFHTFVKIVWIFLQDEQLKATDV